MIMLSTPYTYNLGDDLNGEDDYIENKAAIRRPTVGDMAAIRASYKELIERTRGIYAMKMVNHLMAQGVYVFSPIVYGTSLIAGGLKVPATWDYWKGYCEASVRMCEGVYVVNMKGWETSKGIAGEVDEAKRAKKPVHLIEFDLDRPLKLLRKL